MQNQQRVAVDSKSICDLNSEKMSGRVLVTGGAGFIGSHTCLVLLEAGYDLLVLDNFSNSSPEALTRVAASEKSRSRVL